MTEGGVCEIELPDSAALVRAARDRATELCALPPDWDGLHGLPISPTTAANAVRLVAQVTCPECLPASLSPTAAGNVLVDWTWGEDHVEVEVFPDGRLEVLVHVEDMTWEGELKLDDHGHLGWLGHYVTGVGIGRFQVPAAPA